MKCECSLRGRLLGDGCQICNPSLVIANQKAYIEELEAELDGLLEGEIVKDTMHTGMKNGVIFAGINASFENTYRVLIIKIFKG